MPMTSDRVVQAYTLAKERFADYGVDADEALERLAPVALSLHCWQTDDVIGLENVDGELTGGIATTGNYPGKARTGDEQRSDLDKACSLIPGTHRLALHGSYAEMGDNRVDRDELGPEHFAQWVAWAKDKGMGLDFNPTFFSHPRAADGMTLSSYNEEDRAFWVRHAIACRKIGEHFGRELGSPCVTNIWIPDGLKDTPADRKTPREILKKSLDEIFAVETDPALNLDAVECKLFGIGSESYVVGSHEFYLGYAVANQKLLCLDMGHFHPTESVADKISSVMTFVDEILLHVSRPMRWDSDHVVTLTDELQSLATELVRGDYLSRTHIGLDFFDASINRVAAYVIGVRAVIQALLIAMLEPSDRLAALERDGDFTARLALMEEIKALPTGAVWDYHCLQSGVPVGGEWLDDVKVHERDVLSRRV